MRMPSLSDSSRSSAMPSIFFSLTSSAIFSISRALFTWYGSSVTTIASRPLSSLTSTSARAFMRTRPRPVWYAAWMPATPLMMPAVGKSGPGMCCISSSMPISGSSISAIVASTTSPRLCGGMLVAMPTAMPAEPLTSRFGTRVGMTVGSSSFSS